MKGAELDKRKLEPRRHAPLSLSLSLKVDRTSRKGLQSEIEKDDCASECRQAVKAGQRIVFVTLFIRLIIFALPANKAFLLVCSADSNINEACDTTGMTWLVLTELKS
jgi:hypothetical protein